MNKFIKIISTSMLMGFSISFAMENQIEETIKEEKGYFYWLHYMENGNEKQKEEALKILSEFEKIIDVIKDERNLFKEKNSRDINDFTPRFSSKSPSESFTKEDQEFVNFIKKTILEKGLTFYDFYEMIDRVSSTIKDKRLFYFLKNAHNYDKEWFDGLEESRRENISRVLEKLKIKKKN